MYLWSICIYNSNTDTNGIEFVHQIVIFEVRFSQFSTMKIFLFNIMVIIIIIIIIIIITSHI